MIIFHYLHYFFYFIFINLILSQSDCNNNRYLEYMYDINIDYDIQYGQNINQNISKLNGSFQKNPLVKNVIDFITKDKKRSICTPFS